MLTPLPGSKQVAAHLLLIEGDTRVARAVARMLEQVGHEVYVRRTLYQAIEVLKEEGAALLITGLILPDARGVGIIAAIRRTRPTVPILAVTGGAGQPNPAVLARAGADVTLRRPFGPQALLQAVVAAFPGSITSSPDAQAPPNSSTGGSRG